MTLDLTRVTCEMTLTWLWLDRMSPVKWLESTSDESTSDSWQMTRVNIQVTRVMTHTRTRFSTWIMWSCEPWLCPHLILEEKIWNWYYLVTSVNIKMVHSTPLRVFMYGHWDDHAVDEIFLSVYKRGIHYTILTWGDLKEKMTWLDLTWTIKNRLDLNDLTWLATRVLLTWLDLTCDSSKGDLLQHCL